MAGEQEEEPASTAPPRVIGSVSNVGEPLRFANVEPLDGFAAEPAKRGQQLKVWTKLSLTSDEPLFHRLVENLAHVINHMAEQAGTSIKLRRANTVLLVLKPDATSELWVDTAAVSIRCAVKRAIAAGTVVFEHDIADITGMSFPCVDFGAADKILCLFREDWRFGFAFDLNPEGKLDVEGFTTILGTLYRELRYKHLYDALKEPAARNRLLSAGWFPFVEIITSEFRDLLRHCEAGFDVGEIEDRIIAKFDNARTQRILERWMAKPHFAAKKDLLKPAIAAFSEKEPVTVIKILLTEIEGVLDNAYRVANGGQVTKLKDLLTFAEASAERKAGGANTLLFPTDFGRYLREHTFASFEPIARTGTASSRHAVGHGTALQESYTMPRALQAILTLDQLAFYT
jgi:hypothetical protein